MWFRETSRQDVDQVSFTPLQLCRNYVTDWLFSFLPPRVRTLTGKEIELDIEPDYKVLFTLLCFDPIRIQRSPTYLLPYSDPI